MDIAAAEDPIRDSHLEQNNNYRKKDKSPFKNGEEEKLDKYRVDDDIENDPSTPKRGNPNNQRDNLKTEPAQKRGGIQIGKNETGYKSDQKQKSDGLLHIRAKLGRDLNSRQKDDDVSTPSEGTS